MTPELNTKSLETTLGIAVDIARDHRSHPRSGAILMDAAVLEQSAREYDELVAGGHTGPRHPIRSLVAMFTSSLPSLLEHIGEIVESHPEDFSFEVIDDSAPALETPTTSQ